MDEAALVKSEGSEDHPDLRLSWVEYRLPGEDEIVHRSVHIDVKQAAAGSAARS